MIASSPEFVDDTNLIVPKKTEVCLLEEFEHIQKISKW